jgi:transposase
MSYATVSRWVAKFKNGHKSIEDAQKSGRKRFIVKDKIYEILNKLKVKLIIDKRCKTFTYLDSSCKRANSYNSE